MHGLPIEVKVENEFNIGSKKDIETKIGTLEFINKCKEFALNNLEFMEGQFKNLGIWLDFENVITSYSIHYTKLYEKNALNRRSLLIQKF